MSDSEFKIEVKDFGLNDLIKSLGEDIPMAKVGILGGKDVRKDPNNNSTIGAKHEFGTHGMPVRSFLRIPIIENLQKYLEKSGFFNKEVMLNAIKQKSLVQLISKIGLVGESIVMDAFSTGGFGKWKPSNMKFKKNHQTLVETQQLRNSITSDVGE